MLCINSRSYFLCRMIIIFLSQNEFAPKARRVHRGGLRAALHGGSAFAPVHARSLSGAISTFRDVRGAAGDQGNRAAVISAEAMIPVVPAQAGTHNPGAQVLRRTASPESQPRAERGLGPGLRRDDDVARLCPRCLCMPRICVTPCVTARRVNLPHLRSLLRRANHRHFSRTPPRLQRDVSRSSRT